MASNIRKYFPYLKFVWAGVILYLTLGPGDGEPFFKFLSWPGVDKAGHVVMFLVWALLHFPALFFGGGQRPDKRKTLLVATNSLVLGLLIEVAQAYIPGRSADVWDLLADLLGMATALVVVNYMIKNSDLN